jgi:uncharacterized protein YjcR
LAAPKRNRTQIALDSAQATNLYLQGFTMSDIAEKLEISIDMVKYDLAKVRQNWLEHARLDLNELKAKELAKLDYLEQQVWAQWQQSQQPQTKITQEESEIKGTSTKTETINLAANPKYAETILKIQERRSKMLGYDYDHTGGYPNIEPN